MSGLLPSRGVRWLLLVLACLAAISLFLLATASANTELFASRYDLLLKPVQPEELRRLIDAKLRRISA